jgi:arginine decarboxylase
VWGPEFLAEEGIGEREDWTLKAGERWHGFGDLAEGFNMLDPIKATIITPGLDMDGEFADTGIPAAIVTKYLAEHGVIVEKTGLYSLLHHVHHRHHQGPLEHDGDRAAAVQGRLRPQPAAVAGDARVRRQAPALRARRPARPVPQIHAASIAPRRRPPDHRDVPVGHGAGDEAGGRLRRMAHREIERVPIDELEGRVTAMLVTPYPPGIPLLIPGERFNAHDRALPEVRARVQRSASRASRPTSTAW